MSAIFDGSTDSSYQEAEIVYVPSCTAGKINVYFSLVKNIQRGDAESISKIISDGLENLCADYNKKLVRVGTDGARVMTRRNTGAVQRLRETRESLYIIGVHRFGHIIVRIVELIIQLPHQVRLGFLS